MRKRNYLIGNAHLDPVWQWTWQEGAAEARATFASALERMKEFPDFVFTCAGAGVYQWIEETAPELFREIARRVAEGRWVIVGGMWVQPDCNLPSGEAFARHILYSQRYFAEKFGVTANVGYNVDSFGHNGNLPQLLKKGGMDHYVYMRPMKHEKEMEQNVFIWEAPDGSRVTCFRIPIAYCCNFQSLPEMQEYFERSIAEQPAADASMLFYGVGNHGGGPTKANIEFAKQLNNAGEKMIFGSPIDFFHDFEAENPVLPVHKDDLQHHASGCYAALSEIKRLNKKSEWQLMAAERMSYLAGKLTGMPSVKKEMYQAWQGVMFGQFHDSLGGCSTKGAYPGLYAIYQESISRGAKVENTALQRLAQKIDTTSVPVGQNTLLVFNPASVPQSVVVNVNRQADGIYDETGMPVPSQRVFSETSCCTGRDDTAFLAQLPAMGWRVYHTGPAVETTGMGLLAGNDFMENNYVRVEFDEARGCISRIYSKELGREVYKSAALPILYDETEHDTWSHALNFFDKEAGRFGNGRLTLLEKGPLLGKIKAESFFGESKVTQYFTLTAASRELLAEVTVDFHEKHRMLKLAFDTGLSDPEALYEIQYADITRPADGEEEPGLGYVAVKGSEGTAIVYNDARYSYSVKGSVMNITALRSCLYADHGQQRKAEHTFTDQGESSFSYLLSYADEYDTKADFARKAEAFQLAPRVIYDYVHQGVLPPVYGGVEVGDSILLSVVKEAEDGDGLILRAVEREGKPVETQIMLTPENKVLTLKFEPYQIRTLRLDGTGIREVLITESEV